MFFSSHSLAASHCIKDSIMMLERSVLLNIKDSYCLKGLENKLIPFAPSYQVMSIALKPKNFDDSIFCLILNNLSLYLMAMLPDLTFPNELFSRDEGLHCDFMLVLCTRR